MSTKHIVVAILAATGLLMSISVWAANPADLTVFYRRQPASYYKLIYDDGPWYAYGAFPLPGETSLSYNHWQSEDGHVREEQFFLAKSVSRQLDLTLEAEVWANGPCHSRQELAFDWHSGSYGLAVILPIQPAEEPKLGLRYKQGNCQLFLTARNNTKPLYGFTYLLPKGSRVEVAYGDKVWYARASCQAGQYFPELRTKFTPDETFIGCGLGFCPN